MEILSLFLVAALLMGLAMWAFWGWQSWLENRPEGLAFGTMCSLVAFVFATLSASLEIGTVAYAQFINIPRMHPGLLRIYAFGTLTALLGLVSSLGGLRTSSPLRWKAPVLSVFLLLLWFWEASGE